MSEAMRYVSRWCRRVQLLALVLAISLVTLIIIVVVDGPDLIGFGGIWHVHIWTNVNDEIDFAEDGSTGPPFSVQQREELEWTSIQWFTDFDRRRITWLPFITPVSEEARVSLVGEIEANGRFSDGNYDYWLDQIEVQGDANWPEILQDAFQQRDGSITRIYWPGVAYLSLQMLSIIALPALIVSGIFLFKLLKNSPDRLARENRCPRCKYVLKIDGADTCSECGLTGVRDVQGTTETDSH